MYQKPDFIKVSVKANDVFAAYGASGCQEDTWGQWMYTGACEGTPDYRYEVDTFTGLGLDHHCYSTDKP